MPHLCEFYPGICITTEEKARINLSQGKKNLSQSTVYILPKHPPITKPTQTHTLQNPHTHTHTHIIKQYKTVERNLQDSYPEEEAANSSETSVNYSAISTVSYFRSLASLSLPEPQIPLDISSSRNKVTVHPIT